MAERLSTEREEEKEEQLMLLWGEVKEQRWVWRQIGSPIFTGAVLEELTSNGAIRAESGAHQMPCVWLSLWGYFMLRRIRGSHWSRNMHVYYSQRRKKNMEITLFQRGYFCSPNMCLTCHDLMCASDINYMQCIYCISCWLKGFDVGSLCYEPSLSKENNP